MTIRKKGLIYDKFTVGTLGFLMFGINRLMCRCQYVLDVVPLRKSKVMATCLCCDLGWVSERVWR
jgi:hypothetical protein